MKLTTICIFSLFLLSPVFGADKAWKKVDQELSSGAQKMKSGKAFQHKSKKTGNKVTDGLNNLWDSGLSAVGKTLKK